MTSKLPTLLAKEERQLPAPRSFSNSFYVVIVGLESLKTCPYGVDTSLLIHCFVSELRLLVSY